MKLTILLILFGIQVQARLHPEKYYQDAFAEISGGKTEYVLHNRTRVDILTDKYSIEVEFANNWAESIGQSIYYSMITDKEPGILLIIEDKEKDIKYFNRLMLVALEYGISIWVIYSDLTYERRN